MFYEQMKKALGSIGMTVKAFFPRELEAALLDQAKEQDRLRQDYAHIRSEIEKMKGQ
jgi:hypothetical protein